MAFFITKFLYSGINDKEETIAIRDKNERYNDTIMEELVLKIIKDLVFILTN